MVKLGGAKWLLYDQINLSTSKCGMKRSRREHSMSMVTDRGIFKNNQITLVHVLPHTLNVKMRLPQS